MNPDDFSPSQLARPLAPALADALEAQNAGHAKSARREAHLAALRTGAAVVATGQQVGLLLGPLYTLYKAATAVRLARALEARSGTPVVPVFWLQTEDHDLAEIARCHVATARGEPLSLALPAPAEHVSIKHRRLPDEIRRCLDALQAELSPLPHAAEHLERLTLHYRPEAAWGEAFAGLLAGLFAAEGLVLLDPRDPALATLAAPVHRKALREAKPIADLLGERVRALEAAGAPAPVHVRDAAPLSFFHPDGPEGPRYRLAPTADGYAEVGGSGTHTEAELLAALESRPGCFSTSVLLRPILQDTWLPTAAYVGGPAEVAYFAQLPPLYETFGLRMPRIVARASLRIVDPRPRRLLSKLGLSPADVCAPLDSALRKAHAGAPAGLTGEEVSRRLLEPFDRSLAELTRPLLEAGEGMDRAIEKTRGTVAMAVGKLAGKLDHALLHRNEGRVGEVRRAQQWLFPDGQPQERFYGLSSYAAQVGDRAFVERVLAAAAPFESAPKDVVL